MLRQRLSENYRRFENTPIRKNEESQKYVLNEWRIAYVCFVLSSLIVISKLYFNNQEYIGHLLFEQKLVSYETLSEDGKVMVTHAWKTAVKYSKFWLPALCGFLTTYFTWLMVYLDSCVPGVQPPSPFSPVKYKVQSGHTFHLNYVFAIFIGLFVATYMYWRGTSIEI